MKRILSFFNLIIGFSCFAVLLIPIIGPPLYVEIGGSVAPGIVVAKREVIAPMNEVWSRRLFLDVRYQPADAAESEVTDIAVDAATYDQQRVGASVEVRSMPNPTLRQLGNITDARLTSQLPFASFSARLGNLSGYILAIVVWLVLLMIWSRTKRWWLWIIIFAYMLGGGLYLGSGWPGPAPSGRLAAAEATVRAVNRIDRVWGGRRTAAEQAVQPFLVVQLEFTPADMTDPVVAVDMVDDTGLPAVREGARIPIHYNTTDPRWAQIDNASRTYYWKNLRSFGIIVLMLIVIALFTWLTNRWRLARRSNQSP